MQGGGLGASPASVPPLPASWRDLPPELLCFIVSLVDPLDYLSFAAVCSSWRAAAAATSPAPLSTPYLLSFAPPIHADALDLSSPLAAPAVYRFSLPGAPPIRRFLGSGSNGWLVVADDVSNIHIINPFTGARLPLPPVSSLGCIEARLDSHGEVREYGVRAGGGEVLYNSPKLLGYNLYKKAVLSCDPASKADSNGCVVAVMFRQNKKLFAFARPGKEWITAYGRLGNYTDGVFANGLFFVVTRGGFIEIFDPDKKDQEPVYVPHGFFSTFSNYVYFMKTPWGDLLQVWMRFQQIENNPQFRIFRFNASKLELVELTTLGEYAVFLACNASACISTVGIPGLKPNCLYYLHDATSPGSFSELCHYENGVYDFEEKKFSPLLKTNMYEKWPFPTWIVPQHFGSFDCPVGDSNLRIQLSPHQMVIPNGGND